MLTKTKLSKEVLSEIDPLCIPMVKLFNYIGLKTIYSCQGHKNKYDKQNFKFWIMFDKTVDDNDIMSFLQKMTIPSEDFPPLNTTIAGNFYKWMRATSENEIISNWMYVCDYKKIKTNQSIAATDFKRMIEIINKCKE